MKPVSDHFNNPPASFRPMPFWFWNETEPAKFNRRTITRQIQQMRDKGLGGFVLFNKPPYGFSPQDYLGPKWLRACRFALDAAAECDLKVWINDGFDYPPGGLGGRMRERVPDAYHRQLICQHKILEDGSTLRARCPDGEILSAVARKLGRSAGPAQIADCIDLYETTNCSGKTLSWQPPPGRWETFVVKTMPVTGEEGHLNRFPTYLDPQVSEVFIETVYEKYQQELGSYFGSPLVGFFSDCDARRSHLHPWARQFDERFTASKGYSIRKALPALWHDFGPYGQQVRRDYYHFLSITYSEWFENIHRWCQQHGLLYTYHTSDTGPLSPDPAASAHCKRSSYFLEGRYHEVNRHADFPGTDHEFLALTGQLHFDLRFRGKREDWRAKTVEWGIGQKHNTYQRVRSQNKTFGDVRAKLAASVAHQNNRQGAMCEAFAATNWGVTLEDLRWIVDWQTVQGITRFIPHAFFFSMSGNRKDFAPPNLFGPSHLWEHFQHLTDYMGRLALCLSDGKHVADVAVFDPAAGLWEGTNNQHSDAFFTVADCLNHSPYDYDVVDEKAILKARVGDGVLKIAREVFKVLILPGISFMDESTAAKIRDFIKNGGHVLSVGPLPKGLDPQGIVAVAPLRYSTDTIPVDSPLIAKLEVQITPDCVLTHRKGQRMGSVHFIHIRRKDGDVYFLTNLEGEDEPAELTTSFSVNRGTPQIWDPVTGERQTVEFMRREGRTEIELTLGPRQSTFVVFNRQRQPVALSKKYMPPKLRVLKSIDDWRIEPQGPNVLPLSIWQNGRNHFAWGRLGKRAKTIRFRFHCQAAPDRIRLLLPRPIENKPCTVNATVLSSTAGSGAKVRLLDDDYAAYDVSHLIRKGKNEIVMKASDLEAMRACEYTPPYLQGEFKVQVRPGSSGKRIAYRSWYHFESFISAESHITLSPPPSETSLKPGDWSQQGYPFYSGTMRCTAEVDLDCDDLKSPVHLGLGQIHGCVRVQINGHEAGNLIWRPFQIDISEHLTPGNNKIVLDVSNTLANFLEEYPEPSGLPGEAMLYQG